MVHRTESRTWYDERQFMAIIYTEHALLKLKQRRISRVLVERTLRKPDIVSPGRSGRKAAYRKHRRLYLKVVFVEERGHTVVITAHWDEDFTLSHS